MPEWIKKYLRNVTAGYGLRFVQLGLNLAAIPVLLDALGEAHYGWLVFLSTAVGYFSLLNFGITDAMSKYVAEFHAAADWENLRRLVTTVLVCFLGIAILASLGSYLATLFTWGIEQEAVIKRMVILTGLMCLGAWPLMAIQGIYQGLQEQPFVNTLLGIGRVVCIGTSIHGALSGWRLEYIFIAFNADKFLLTPVLTLCLRGYVKESILGMGSFSISMLRKVFSFSRWLMLARIATFLEYQVDSLLIMIFVGPEGVALYNVLCTPFRMIQQFSGIAASAFVPVMSSRNLKQSSQNVRQTILGGSGLHNAFLASVCVILLVNAESLLTLWLNGKYSDYYWLVMVLIGFQTVWQANAFLGSCVVGLGHARRLGWLAVATGVLNVTLSLILVNFFGTVGVIFGTLAAGVIATPIGTWLLVPQAGMQIKEYMLRLLGSQVPIWLCGLGLYGVFYADMMPWNIQWFVLLCITGLLVSGVAYLTSVRPLLLSRRLLNKVKETA